MAQTRVPDEILVSDDLGSEETQELVMAFAQRASFPVRYVLCATGQSLADNINNCLREAACDLVLLLHDDDLLTPRAVEALSQPFEENKELVGVFGKQLIISDGGEEQPGNSEGLNTSYRRNATYAGLQADAIVSGLWQQFPNDGYMVKTSVARKVLHEPRYRAASEVDFGIRMGEQGAFYFVDEYTAKYRLSAQSLSRGASSRQEDFSYHAMHIWLRLLETYPCYKADILSKLRNTSPIAICMAMNTGRLNEAISWYFGPNHRDRILTLGGIRRGLWLVQAWLREKMAIKQPAAPAKS